MRFYYPRSFFKLLAVGFTLIALPLIFALVNNAISIDQLANRSQQAVYRAVQAIQSSRRLAERITAMERSARQKVILDDPAVLETYVLNRKEFLATAGEFATLPFDTEQRQALDAILLEEARIFATLASTETDPKQLRSALAGFVSLADRSRAISARSNQLIEREVDAMQATAAQARQITVWQLLALVPVVVFLVVGFTILIARPIGQIDAAIRRLGGGDLDAAVRVTGPEDLQILGERLDWMRQRLADLEQQKNRFLRQMSHELKTPLTALREGAELLSDEVVGKLTAEQREIVEILRHNSIELQKLIEDLLGYGASRFHRTALELKPVSVRKAIEIVAENQKLALRARDLKLKINADDCTLSADFEKLRVMLDNLVSNAIKFSPPGGTITIAARVYGKHLTLDVADEGPGIPPADRVRIFDPFYQGQQPAGGRINGTGIGLSVVREYAAAHGGAVAVVDDGRSRGARVRVTLPLFQGSMAA